MPIKKHILIILPDGVGIRNYLYSDIITHLKKEAQITIWSPLPKEAFKDVETIHNIQVGYKQIQLASESSLGRLYREATTYARLIYNCKSQNNPTILTNWRRPKYSFKVKVLYRTAEVLGKFLSKKYSSILRFENKALSHVSKVNIADYKIDLEALQPTSILITHQRVPGLLPICLAAKQLNIATTTAVFSWDNLPKARLAVKTDTYLVWSQWMKDEMKTYYPEIEEERVILTGTPQFEFYLDKSRIITREDFAKQYGLDVKKKWICFSGDDFTTSPYDQMFLNDVAESLYSEKDRIQIIFRRCPVDFSSRYDEALNAFKDFIIPIDPIWNVQSETGWVGYFSKYEDLNLQINFAFHCSIVVNLGSTMALDFATFNKPCLYLRYDPIDDGVWSTKITYNYQHFRSMKDLDVVGWINSKSEIFNTISKALETPDQIAQDKKKWMETVVLHPLDENSIKIAKAIL